MYSLTVIHNNIASHTSERLIALQFAQSQTNEDDVAILLLCTRDSRVSLYNVN